MLGHAGGATGARLERRGSIMASWGATQERRQARKGNRGNNQPTTGARSSTGDNYGAAEDRQETHCNVGGEVCVATLWPRNSSLTAQKTTQRRRAKTPRKVNAPRQHAEATRRGNTQRHHAKTPRKHTTRRHHAEPTNEDNAQRQRAETTRRGTTQSRHPRQR